MIELDGDIHLEKEQALRDIERDDYLRSIGNTVLRFKNEQVLNDIEKVLETIAGVVLPLHPHPGPFSQREKGVMQTKLKRV